MIQINVQMPNSCKDCLFFDSENCGCIASDYDDSGIMVANAYRTNRRDIRCPLNEIVSCKDCRMSKIEKVYKNVPKSKETVRYCELIMRYVDDDWFCADGRRREE